MRGVADAIGGDDRRTGLLLPCLALREGSPNPTTTGTPRGQVIPPWSLLPSSLHENWS